MPKLKSIDELKVIVERHKTGGKKIVFTNGCFDILHLGHVRYLKAAKCLGDVLIVALNSDKSVKHIKGNKRPIMGQLERAEILAALEFVDYVVIFDEPTPIETILVLKPHIHVKGGDYSLEELSEAEAVKSYGGGIVILPEVEGWSTTKVINTIIERASKRLQHKHKKKGVK